MKSAVSFFIILLSLWSNIIIPGSKAETDSIYLINNANSLSQQQLSEQVLRLHVIANSDSAEDQKVKLLVRDAIVDLFTSELSQMNGITQALEYAKNNMDLIQKTADEILKREGFDYRSKIEVSQSLFPEKKYGDITFPAGIYTAVRVTLGEGKGQNWWCVLYPPLCFLNVKTDKISSQENTEDTNTIKIKWKLSEWFNKTTE